MLHHASINAHDPARSAHVLAELTGACAIAAPCPPFPANSWFVCFGDAHGSMVEVLPWGIVRDRLGAGGTSEDLEMRRCSGSHLLLSSRLCTEQILAAADRAGWQADVSDALLFRFVKVWFEGHYLVELLPPEHAEGYLRTFGTDGLPQLDGELRRLEATMRTRLQAR